MQITLAVVPAVSTIFAALGLLLNVQQSKRTNAKARAALLSNCLKDFADDKEMQQAFYAIEYSEFIYGVHRTFVWVKIRRFPLVIAANFSEKRAFARGTGHVARREHGRGQVHLQLSQGRGDNTE